MGPSMIRGNFSDLFGVDQLPLLEELTMFTFAQHPMRRDSLFKTVSTDRDLWQSSETHDLPLFREVGESTDYSFERAKQGYDKTFLISKYGSGFSITQEAVEDGKFDLMADLARKLGRSARETQEIQAMNVINNGSSSETTADGVALFSNAHTLPSGGTYRNILSSAADLSDQSLRQMRADFETQFVGDTGIIYDIAPRILLVHSDNRMLANELIKSERRVNDVSSSGDNGPTNSMNALREEGLRVISSPHLADPDAWGLFAAPEDNGLRIVKRKAFSTDSDSSNGFKNDSMYVKGSYREKVGAIHPWGSFWTAGNG